MCMQITTAGFIGCLSIARYRPHTPLRERPNDQVTG